MIETTLNQSLIIQTIIFSVLHILLLYYITIEIYNLWLNSIIDIKKPRALCKEEVQLDNKFAKTCLSSCFTISWKLTFHFRNFLLLEDPIWSCKALNFPNFLPVKADKNCKHIKIQKKLPIMSVINQCEQETCAEFKVLTLDFKNGHSYFGLMFLIIFDTFLSKRGKNSGSIEVIVRFQCLIDEVVFDDPKNPRKHRKIPQTFLLLSFLHR